ncbi:MAG: type I-F CRISPR-associated protein Csy1 [Dokdonella sp.]|nr:MAG: type I-F CRISPR-associated protein Csy1 [Dokdonella sp.]
MDTPRSERAERFRTAIAGFIETRREAKLKGKEEDADAASRYDYGTWLADAARRVGQIQAVTHVLKATHPDARGSSLHVKPDRLPPHAEIGSHSLGAKHAEDVVGNAAALDVFKFLKVEVEGRQLLAWMQDRDADLQAALSRDAAQAEEWTQAFASLVRNDNDVTSHPLAKQLYWLVGEEPQDDGQYHLLQPLFASALAQAVHDDIQAARFGEANKLARQAFRAGDAHAEDYRDYRGLAVRKLGGTKPQNISQLNSERGGVNYLLASLPPVWTFRQAPQLLRQESALKFFRGFGNVPELLRSLGAFLQSEPESNKETRDRREAMEQALCDELAMFAGTVREHHPPGWTRDAACRLPRCEQLWLDSERSELPVRNDPEHPEWKEDDEAFNRAYANGDWADEVATRFGLWLNKLLRERHTKLVTLGEVETRHWARCAREVLS